MNKCVPLLLLLIAAVCITPVLAASPGYISVTTSPTGGQVYIDHKYVMDSPGTSEVKPGSHLVYIESSEYFSWSDEVFVRPGETTKVDAVMHFYKGPGSIGVSSSMPEVDVYVDDLYYTSVKSGTATVPNLSPASHEVRVVKAGYHDFITTVQVLSDKIVGVHSDQTKDTKQAGIRVNSDPGGAVVYLDDEYVGLTLGGNEWIQVSGVSLGNHTLRFSKDGYNIHELSREYKTGEVSDVRANLKLIPEETVMPTATTTAPTTPPQTAPPAPTKTAMPLAALIVLGIAGVFLRR